MWKRKSRRKIAPDRRELSPEVTEGACGRCSCGLLWGWCLIEVIDAPPSTAVTIPGGSGKERLQTSLVRNCQQALPADTLCRFYLVVASSGHRKWDSFGEVPPPADKQPVRPLAPSVLGLRPKPPPSRREVWGAYLSTWARTLGKPPL